MSDKASDEFIAWHVEAFGFCNLIAPECYMRWLAWQASRAALVVELPTRWKDSNMMFDSEVAAAIHATGVTTK